jgi:hypothetical protein
VPFHITNLKKATAPSTRWKRASTTAVRDKGRAIFCTDLSQRAQQRVFLARSRRLPGFWARKAMAEAAGTTSVTRHWDAIDVRLYFMGAVSHVLPGF